MRILPIDNGTKLLSELQSLIPGHEITKRWDDVSPSDANNCDLIILSGSNASVVWNYSDFKNDF